MSSSVESSEDSIRKNRSISQLKSLSKCGESFRLERIERDQIEPRPAAWTISGSAFHEALVDWEKSGREGELGSYFESWYDKLILEAQEQQPDLSKWMRPPRTKSTESDIANYRKRFMDRDCPNYERRCREAEWEIAEFDGKPALELEFELELAGVPIRGVLDRIQWWPQQNVFAIEDTKTGSPDNHEHDPRQLILYGVAAREVFNIPLQMGRYWFTKLDRPSKWVDLTRFNRQWLEREFENADRIISEGLFIANPSSKCDVCSVAPWCSIKGWLKLGEKM